VRTGQLKAEPRNDKEVAGFLAMARRRLADAAVAEISPESRFLCAYNAAHAAALAALRWHGYRSDKRVTVFQSLAHTVGWPAAKWRVLDAAHKKRNIAEYEGMLEVEESNIEELRALTAVLIADVSKLTGEATQ
jgi:hypothetical protein